MLNLERSGLKETFVQVSLDLHVVIFGSDLSLMLFLKTFTSMTRISLLIGTSRLSSPFGNPNIHEILTHEQLYEIYSYLLVPPLTFPVSGFNGELSGKDVGQLSSISISTSSSFFLRVIIVTASQEMSKNHLGDVNTFLLMDFNRYAVPIVIHTYEILVNINLHLQKEPENRSVANSQLIPLLRR